MHYMKKLAWMLNRRQEQKDGKDNKGQSGGEGNILSRRLKNNLDVIKAKFDNSSDLIIREFCFGKDKSGKTKAALVFLDGLTNLPLINDHVIRPLMHESLFSNAQGEDDASGMEAIRDKLLSAGEVKTIYTYDEVIEACLSGNAVLMAEDSCKALDIGAKGWEKRAVSEPVSETAVRAPREGFTENLRTNTSMIRRKIKDPALKIRSTVIGKRSHTQVNILYIDGLADPELVCEVERRLNKIDVDAILAAGYVEQYINDAPFSVFPTIWCSEKPDAVAGKLLEGRVAIAVDGTPFVMTVPMLFIENFQSAEDYITHSYHATMMRMLRMLAFFICLFAPAVFIALSAYHQELIPTTFLFSMAASSEGTPFPVAVETGVMMVIFLLLREAGVRMPRPVGQTISIVGALVMGDAAVQAGIVGAPVVIVVALTAVSGFAVPFVTDAITLLSWFLMIMASAMGSFGITIAAFIILIHLASLRSFGARYLAPLTPFQKDDLKDTAVRVPLWAMRTRPKELRPRDIKRENTPVPIDYSKNENDRRQKS